QRLRLHCPGGRPSRGRTRVPYPTLFRSFDRCKSELHWLEYAMSDMAFIGERFRGEGRYQVIRDGVDGLLARGAQECHDAVRQLTDRKSTRLNSSHVKISYAVARLCKQAG